MGAPVMREIVASGTGSIVDARRRGPPAGPIFVLSESAKKVYALSLKDAESEAAMERKISARLSLCILQSSVRTRLSGGKSSAAGISGQG
jgi:hypothetical protein